MEQNTIDHIRQCYESHKGKQRELAIVKDNFLKSVLRALAEGGGLDDILDACGFSTETREAECFSIFGDQHTHQEPANVRFARWITNELGDFLTKDPLSHIDVER